MSSSTTRPALPVTGETSLAPADTAALKASHTASVNGLVAHIEAGIPASTLRAIQDIIAEPLDSETSPTVDHGAPISASIEADEWPNGIYWTLSNVDVTYADGTTEALDLRGDDELYDLVTDHASFTDPTLDDVLTVYFSPFRVTVE